MKSLLTFIFLLLFFIPINSFCQIKISGTQGLYVDSPKQPAAFVRKEVVVTKTIVEKAPSAIVVSNKISNSEVYGTNKGVNVELKSENQLVEGNANQIVIDLAEAKKEMELASLPMNKFSASTLDNPNLIGFAFFDAHSSKIRPEYYTELKKLQEVLTSMPNMDIQIIGHADSKASEYGNTEIASTRANFIYDFLTEVEHMDPNRFEISTSEENFFKVPSEAFINATNQSEKNRSVSFILKERKNETTSAKEVVITEKTPLEKVVSVKNENYSDGQVIGFIFFDENNKKVKQEYYSELFKLNEVIEKMPDTQIIIIGHGDVNASEKNAPMIGKERSEAVYTFLTTIFKMDPKRFEIYHEGENLFPVPNGNEVNATSKAEMNRSVTIILK